MSELFLSISHEDSSFVVVFEDDGKVAYAYLLDGSSIVGDVWLYNQTDAPLDPEWIEPSKAPFSNAVEFVSTVNYSPITRADEIDLNWIFKSDGKLEKVELFLRGNRHAIIAPDAKPGWCILAIKNGPLANALTANH